MNRCDYAASMRNTIVLSGMRCGKCVSRLTQALRRLPSVTSVEVTLSPPQAVVISDGPLPESTLLRAVTSAGHYTGRIATNDDDARNDASTRLAPTADSQDNSLFPLALILAYLLLVCTLAESGKAVFSWHSMMNHFMAGFFLIFSFFKLLDLRGFADAFQTYDLFARRSRWYALAYPFIELALGAAYLLAWQLPVINSITLVLMLLGAIGVAAALRKGNRLRCACLGSALNLPMTSVTLLEDLTMAAMAATGLFWPAPTH